MAEAPDADEKDKELAVAKAPLLGPDNGPAPAGDVTVIDDAQTEQAVDDIIRTESDELLEAHDNAAVGKTIKQARRGFWRGIGHFFSAWWRHKVLRYLTILLVLGGVAAGAIMPTSRYWVLNHAGVRVSASVHVLDDTSGQPLKDIQISIDGHTVTTGANGRAKVSNLLLGPHILNIKEPGFTSVTRKVVLGWGSNPLGRFELRSVGVQYVVSVHDFLTDKPIQNAEIVAGDSVAISDKTGKALLTIPGTQAGDIAATVARAGYRSETISIKTLSTTPTKIQLVTARKTVFVTKESGKYDVYSSDIDGKNKKVILAGTGSEDANITLVTSPGGTHAALVSSRDNQRDADGYLLSTLTLINIDDGSLATITHAEQIQLVGWIGTRLVFEQVSAETKGQAAKRYTIISYDYTNSTRLQLAASTHFNTVFSAQGSVYYAVAADGVDATTRVGLYRINADGTGKQTAFDKEVWSAYRTEYNTLSLQTDGGWHTYTIATGATAQVSAPSSYATRGYIDHPANGQSLWIDNRDGLGVMLRYTVQGAKDTAIHTQSGLGYPLRWLGDDIAVYRVVTGSETADYVISTLGGQTPHKITDVTNTYGFASGQ